MAGSASVASYFSALFATRSHSAPGGLATSIPLALFGLSPLFLSYVATLPVFQLAAGELNASKFVAFLAVGVGSANLFSTFGLQVRYDLPHVVEPDALDDTIPDQDVSERTHLLKKPISPPGTPGSSALSISAETEHDGTVLGLLSDPSFWLFAAVVLVITGSVRYLRSLINESHLAHISSPHSPRWSSRTLGQL